VIFVFFVVKLYISRRTILGAGKIHKNTKQNTRGAIVSILMEWEQGRGFASDLLEKLWKRTDFAVRDRALINITVNGVIRRKLTLDWLIDRFSSRKLPESAGYLRQILRLSIFHLLYLDSIPPHAILHQAGELAKRQGDTRKCSYINGLLRNLLRKKDELPFPDLNQPAEHLSVLHSHPLWIVNRWLETRHYEEVKEICRVDNLPAPVFVRCNRLKSTPEELEAELKRDGIDYKRLAESLDFWRIKPSKPIGSLRSFRDGHFQVQDISTIRAVDLLNPKPGENIADLCAAPGGKAVYIAQRMNNTGSLLAADSNPVRLEKLDENLRRLGVSNASIERINPLRGETSRGNTQWDGILLDVPCSNTGVLRRRVDARWRVTAADITRLAKQGRELLAAASHLIQPGGRIVYSTCSLEPEENGETVRRFIETNTDFKLIKEELSLPSEDQGDGHYCALIKHVQ
jgi:16S rRNA (cytosine967-C5)-methyltransferase